MDHEWGVVGEFERDVLQQVADNDLEEGAAIWVPPNGTLWAITYPLAASVVPRRAHRHVGGHATTTRRAETGPSRAGRYALCWGAWTGRVASRWLMGARNVSSTEIRIHSRGLLRPGPPASISGHRAGRSASRRTHHPLMPQVARGSVDDRPGTLPSLLENGPRSQPGLARVIIRILRQHPRNPFVRPRRDAGRCDRCCRLGLWPRGEGEHPGARRRV